MPPDSPAATELGCFLFPPLGLSSQIAKPVSCANHKAFEAKVTYYEVPFWDPLYVLR